ncbi:MAG TPA: xanthine dehydrogenase family protein subunit M [Chloroflexota bacterium]|nr:xanthine dehydrogenase family protein subunit M [Chloroflexota bacterium]
MQAFEYNSPATVEEAVGILAAHNGRARPLAGGTDLLVQLRAERFHLERVVDLKAIPELNALRFTLAEGLLLGAAVPCYRVYEHPGIAAAYPALVDSASIVGGIAIQGRASVGGNLCNASPSGDTIPSLIVLGATCNLAGPQGRRSLPVEQFCVAPGATALGPGELLVSLQLPPPRPRAGSLYLRFIPRNEMDIAVVGAGASVVLADDGQTIAEARVALGAVAPRPLYVEAAGAQLVGTDGSAGAIERAATAAREAVSPITDMRGTIAQRRHLAGVMTARAIEGALRRAKGQPVRAH